MFASLFRKKNRGVGVTAPPADDGAVTPSLTLTVNGSSMAVEAEGDAPLLYVLRNDFCLNGPKYGCGLGECGACAVLIGGRLARSCVIPVSAAVDLEVTTLEGLGTPQQLGVVQQAFVDCQAAQCGYCINGMIMSAHALLTRNPDVTQDDIKRALQFNLCRCGTHVEILQAVMLASERLKARRAK